MLNGILYRELVRTVVLVLVGLVLFGVLPAGMLAGLALLFVGWRISLLGAEAVRRPVTTAVLQARAQPTRGRWELAAEALGALTFILLAPTIGVLQTREFFSLRVALGWTGAGMLALCVALYAWPHGVRKPALAPKWRMAWWALPFFPALLLAARIIDTRHPYLDPFCADHKKLAAERVLALPDNVLAGRHADWVRDYAGELDGRGDRENAAAFYRAALRLDASDADAAERLGILEGNAPAIGEGDARNSSALYWTADHPVKPALRSPIDAKLETVAGCTVIVVAVGEVADEVLDAVAHTIAGELKLPVLVRPDRVPLPEHTRVHGLLTGRQWAVLSLATAFENACKPLPGAPLKYVLVTPADIYDGNANYVFSASGEWGCVVSFARYRDPATLMAHRTAKQCLCGLLKCFGVPVSFHRDCVTSYSRSLDEFDAKGNRPHAETLALFQKAVADMNARWEQFRARR